jgi:hypothetical protein
MSRNFVQIMLYYAVHAASFFGSDFVSVANKGQSTTLDTVGVWGSNPHAPTIFN